ncbi:hypothetical protein [Hippea alviniae]|uniref:hypothetical protein n=1 Tax=Hippea alviniae TaxID=1279027 RepID=UPI0003B41DC3|nr:hypothetical protein [Hippea alviniae]
MPKYTLEIEGRGAEFHIGAVSEKLFQQIKERGVEAYIDDELELGENDVGWHDLDLFSCYAPSLYDSSITVYDENYNVVDEFSGEDVQSFTVSSLRPACSPKSRVDKVPAGKKLIAVVSIYDGRWGSLELEINKKFYRDNFYFVNCDLTSMEILESDLTFIIGAVYCNSCSDEDLDTIYEQIESDEAKKNH